MNKTPNISIFEHCKAYLPQATSIPLPNAPLLPKHNPHEILQLIHQPLTNHFYSWFLFAGRRILAPYHLYSIEDSVNLFSGRRIRIYHTIKIHNKIKIYFGWMKFKVLTKEEKQNLTTLLSEGIEKLLTEAGMKFIISYGGRIFPHNILYNHFNI